MTAFGIIGTIAADARDGLVAGNLVEQVRHYRCIAGCVLGHFNGSDFQRGRVNSKVRLAPLAAVVGPKLFGLLLAFAQHLDNRAVDQEEQSRFRRLRSDRHRKIFMAPANGAEVGHLPVHASELEQAFRHSHRLAQARLN